MGSLMILRYTCLAMVGTGIGSSSAAAGVLRWSRLFNLLNALRILLGMGRGCEFLRWDVVLLIY